MFTVISAHIVSKGNIILSNEPIISFLACVLYAMGVCSMDAYALISGYVGVDTKFKFSRFALLWFNVLFYSVVITIIFIIIKPNCVGIKELAKSFFPIMTESYWYFTAYFCVFLFSPIINLGMNNMSRNQLKYCAFSIIIAFSFLQILFGEKLGTNGGCSGFWLIVLYIFGAYIRKTDFLPKLKSGYAFACYFLLILLACASKVFAEHMSVKLGLESTIGSLLSNQSGRLMHFISPLIVVAAVCIFTSFNKMKFTNKGIIKTIGFFSPLAFSVYLIHVHPLIWAYAPWSYFEVFATFNPIKMLIYTLISTIVIFILCALIDKLRLTLFGAIKLKQKLDSLEFKLCRKIQKQDVL